MKRNVLFPVLMLVILLAVSGSAEEMSSLFIRQKKFIEMNGDKPIHGIEFRGLSRTRKEFIQGKIPLETGRPLSSFNPDETVRALQGLNLFHEIELEYKTFRDGVEIIIVVKEKYTLMPLPIIIYAGEYQLYGLYVLDMNFLGIGKKFYGGGSYTPRKGWKAQAGYYDPGIFYSRFALWSKVLLGDEIFENRMPGEEVFQRFKAGHILVELAPGYRFQKTHTLSLVGRYRYGNPEYVKDALLVPSAAGIFFQGLRYNFRDMRHRRVFSYGWSVMTEYMRGIPIKGGEKGRNYGRMKALLSFPLFWGTRLVLSSRGGAGSLPPVFEKRIGGISGFKTLPRNEVAADHYLSGTVTGEYPFWIHDNFTMTAAVSWEQGTYKKDEMARVKCYGPGGGIRVYLKKIAMPALGLDLVYNVAVKEYLFAAAIGFAL